MLVARVRGHVGNGLLTELRPLFLDRLPLGVLHDVGVVLAAVGQRHPLQVPAAVVL